MEAACLRDRGFRYCRDLQSTNTDEGRTRLARHQQLTLPCRPLPSLRSPHRAQRPPPPLHIIHQHPNRLSHHSPPRSPHSSHPAASAVSPHPRTPAHLSRARWHSFTRRTLRLSGAIYRGGRRRRLEDGMLCGRREIMRGLWEGVNLRCWRTRTWIGREFGIVALLAMLCLRR